MGLCIGGNAQPPHKNIAKVYDILFYETEWYRDTIKHHPNIRQAFGINTNIFYPKPQPPRRSLCSFRLSNGHNIVTSCI